MENKSQSESVVKSHKLSFDAYFSIITKDFLRSGFNERQIDIVKLLCETFEVRGMRRGISETIKKHEKELV